MAVSYRLYNSSYSCGLTSRVERLNCFPANPYRESCLKQLMLFYNTLEGGVRWSVHDNTYSVNLNIVLAVHFYFYFFYRFEMKSKSTLKAHSENDHCEITRHHRIKLSGPSEKCVYELDEDWKKARCQSKHFVDL
jgi:hypothetical protein